VDRVLGIGSHTIHEITLSYTKERNTVLCSRTEQKTTDERADKTESYPCYPRLSVADLFPTVTVRVTDKLTALLPPGWRWR
jgi:hypothetical protein